MLSQSIKTLLLTLFAVTFAFLFTACDDDSSTGPDPNESQLETHTATDIAANPSDQQEADSITYYSLREQAIVSPSDSASNNWDIAFSALKIYINNGSSGPGSGGAIVLDQAFDTITEAPTSGYAIDTKSELAVTGWYNYTGRNNGQPPQHAVLPIENKTIVLKTGDGENYAKLRVISYYKGNPDTSTEEFESLQTRPPSRYYTFEYAIQLNGTTELN